MNYLCIQSYLAQKLMELHKPETFRARFSLYYQGQVPNVAILLISGSALVEGSGEPIKVEAPALLGARELFQSEISDSGVIIEAGSVACILDKSQLLNVLSMFPEMKSQLQSA